MHAEVQLLGIDDLCNEIRTYLNPREVENVRRAYTFSADAHEGQLRISGEPYIQHPLEVATILATMHMDHDTLVAAILHDVIEDTGIGKDHISREFGSEVADIVDGLSKLTQIEFETQAERQAQNFQKMLMAMADDIRVIMVKLADRLHNMRTLSVLSTVKRRRIARETLDIYAPIAQRLGLNAIRLELQDLGFATLYPNRYRVLKREMQRVRGNRREMVEKINNRTKRALRQEQIAGHVIGREKSLYSVYKKMREKTLPFAEVHDVYAFRIIVDRVDTCYRVLGVLHGLYKPVPGKFKDYVAIPKSNGYQSLHTVLFGPYGVPIEVQIRTNEMDQVAEAGIAAHWLYKTGDNAARSAHQRARDWLRGVLEMQAHASDSAEFLENVRVDLFPDKVYVFTPKGEIMELPRGATAVDLAYAVHTGVGNRCVACRINRRLAPLHTKLATGQTVEIVTAPGARPNPTWLTFVVTGKARSTIRHYLKNLQDDEAQSLGKRMLERELERLSTSLERLPAARINDTLTSFKLDSLTALLEEIGLGNRPAPLVARALAGGSETETAQRRRPRFRRRPDKDPAPLLIHGTEGMVVTLPKCCHPIPGDVITGFLSAGRGIVIHRQGCANVKEMRNDPERWIDVEWAHDIERDFNVEIVVNVANRRGTLATVAATVAEEKANIEEVETRERDENEAQMRLVISVRDRRHLAAVLRRLHNLTAISRAMRRR